MRDWQCAAEGDVVTWGNRRFGLNLRWNFRFCLSALDLAQKDWARCPLTLESRGSFVELGFADQLVRRGLVERDPTFWLFVC